MINIDDKLYITKEINAIILNYAKEVILLQLLEEFSFEPETEKKELTSLIEVVNFHNGDTPPPEIGMQLIDLIGDFINKLTKEKLTALYIWVLNRNYSYYLDESDIEMEGDTLEKFNFKFGRELAYKLYDPENSELEDDLNKELTNLLICFASESDLSIIDESSVNYVKDLIEEYCT